jgi:glycosyltransferase involved in cell wall biosynthesis
MNILASIHLYPPKHNCGAEWMAHRIFKYLRSKGHNVRILLNQANHYKITNNYCFEDIDVFPPNPAVIEGLFGWADVVFTHLDYSKWTIAYAQMRKKPVFHLIHNSHPYPEIINAQKEQYIVYNSDWLKNELQYKFDNFTLTPPIDTSHFDSGIDTIGNEFITLINLNENKGGKIFELIARALPNKRFLAVKGSYDEQCIPNLPNITVAENTPNIRSVYDRTRLLLMPSKYESWGMTASEAMCYGIPVICTDGPGLKENCGKAGTYIKNRDNVKEWVDAIIKMDDEKSYHIASKKAKARAKEQEPNENLGKFEYWVREMANKYK